MVEELVFLNNILKIHTDIISCLKVYKEENKLISGSWDKSISIIDLNDFDNYKILDKISK